MKGFYEKLPDGRIVDRPPCSRCLHRNKLLYEMAVDIMEEGGHDLSPVEASALERAEVARRLNVYLEQLPEYQDRISFVFERK